MYVFDIFYCTPCMNKDDDGDDDDDDDDDDGNGHISIIEGENKSLLKKLFLGKLLEYIHEVFGYKHDNTFFEYQYVKLCFSHSCLPELCCGRSAAVYDSSGNPSPAAMRILM